MRSDVTIRLRLKLNQGLVFSEDEAFFANNAHNFVTAWAKLRH